MAFKLFKKEPQDGDRTNLMTTLQAESELSPGHDAMLSAPTGAAHAQPAKEQAPASKGKTPSLNRNRQLDSKLDSLLEDETAGSFYGPDGASGAPGLHPNTRLQTFLFVIVFLAIISLILGGWWVIWGTDREAGRLADVNTALVNSQRLAYVLPQSITGTAKDFDDIRKSSTQLGRKAEAMKSDLGDEFAPEVGKVSDLSARILKTSKQLLDQQKQLTDTGNALRAIAASTGELRASAEQISALSVQHGGSPIEISATGRLVMLTERIGKTAADLLSGRAVDAAELTAFSQNLTTMQDTAQGLLDGNAQMHLSAQRDQDTRAKIQGLIGLFNKTHTQAATVTANLQAMNAARSAQVSATTDAHNLVQTLQGIQDRMSENTGRNWLDVLVLLGPILIGALAVLGLFNQQLRSIRQRQAQADQERLAAEQQRQDVKRINDANQAAILRLMNELQTVAEGDLTQEATVTEDITGAIADSVNYTVEELRTLVGNVQGAALRVTETTSKVEETSTELLAASTEQLREIHATGQSVVDMAGRINQVSKQAQESSEVARQSLKAATSGLTAVQNSIGGMNAIRDQIQETSKRIKRLGESSQEIGEITELIADITEQTNVLALNAAIQAASAGEAGRGFSVVAEEVQRLAERSGGATRQIAVLVKAIQTDTQDAMAAMERSTRGVVEGARLSDNAGTALTEIDRVSRRLAQLIEQISSSTVQEAKQANTAANSIQHIFAVTEQTGESTRTTASQVRELARIADELRQSVARFKIS